MKKLGFKIDYIICGERTTKNTKKVLLPYFNLFVDNGKYVGYENLKGLQSIPNKEFTQIQPSNGLDAELSKYQYTYNAPVQLINLISDGPLIDQNNLQTEVQMIQLHDWREMPGVVRLRQGDTFTHVWNNHNLLRTPIIKEMARGNYVANRSTLNPAKLLKTEIDSGSGSTRDSGLVGSTALKQETIIEQTEADLQRGGPRKRQRTLNELTDIAFDQQSRIQTNSTKERQVLDRYHKDLGSLTIINRPIIDKELYKNEDAPELVLLHVPPALKPSVEGTRYFTFEITYMLEVECYYNMHA